VGFIFAKAMVLPYLMLFIDVEWIRFVQSTCLHLYQSMVKHSDTQFIQLKA